jgi:hypothetical protein
MKDKYIEKEPTHFYFRGKEKINRHKRRTKRVTFATRMMELFGGEIDAATAEKVGSPSSML